jgi:hypothetical protein
MRTRRFSFFFSKFGEGREAEGVHKKHEASLLNRTTFRKIWLHVNRG